MKKKEKKKIVWLFCLQSCKSLDRGSAIAECIGVREESRIMRYDYACRSWVHHYASVYQSSRLENFCLNRWWCWVTTTQRQSHRSLNLHLIIYVLLPWRFFALYFFRLLHFFLQILVGHYYYTYLERFFDHKI